MTFRAASLVSTSFNSLQTSLSEGYLDRECVEYLVGRVFYSGRVRRQEDVAVVTAMLKGAVPQIFCCSSNARILMLSANNVNVKPYLFNDK